MSHASVPRNACRLGDNDDDLFFRAHSLRGRLFHHAEPIVQCSRGLAVGYGMCLDIERRSWRVSGAIVVDSRSGRNGWSRRQLWRTDLGSTLVRLVQILVWTFLQ